MPTEAQPADLQSAKPVPRYKDSTTSSNPQVDGTFTGQACGPHDGPDPTSTPPRYSLRRYKYRSKDSRGTRNQTNEMKMELCGVNWVLAVMGFFLWSSGGFAAPMECHFDSRAQCEFEGRQYALGESWMNNACMQCTCLYPVGVGCCETLHRPVDFPAWCQMRVEPVTCKVSLVLTSDPRLPCTPGDNMRDPSHGSQELQQHLEK